MKAFNPINLQEFPNFFSEDFCKELIDIGETDFEIAREAGAQYEDAIEETKFYLDSDSESLKTIREIVAEQTGLPIENQEPMSFIKYHVGGTFKAHLDCFHDDMNFYEGLMRQGGNRVKTCLIYLNEGFEGGETEFSKLNYRVVPKTGLMVTWNNTNAEGEIIPESEHEGLSVISGIKYVLSIWIRERAFKNLPIIA